MKDVDRETKQNLAAPVRIWDWHLAPDVLKAKAMMNGDDVDCLLWVPEHFEGNTILDAFQQSYWTFYFEEDAQKFLGPEHQGDGFLGTVCHA